MEKETRPFISWQLADDFMTAVFEKMGVPTEDARLCSDVLLESDRRGIESHGCNRFKPIYIDRIKSGILNPVTKIDILKETPTTAVLDANDGMGMVASKKAMDMCIEKHINTVWVWLQSVTLPIMESQDIGQVSQQRRI